MSIKIPTPGRDILYKSKLGNYILPGKAVVTIDNLFSEGVEAGLIDGLTTPVHIHAKVFSPGDDYVEQNIPHARVHPDYDSETNPFPPGSWAWPDIVPDRWYDADTGLMDGAALPMSADHTDW